MIVSALEATGFALTAPGGDVALHLDGRRAFAADASPPQTFEQIEHDIWDLVTPDRRPELDEFSVRYAAVRTGEGREMSAVEVRALPSVDSNHPLASMWVQRAESFERLVDALPSPVDGRDRVVDIGAGCGWMSAQLARRGWRPAALDVTVAGGDGLAAARHHDEEILLVRADMIALPFASDSVDLAVFNASLHYAARIEAALAEAVRIVAPGGSVVVLDSPVYRSAVDGAQMVAEFAAATRDRLGVDAADHQGPGFVTWDQVDAAGLEQQNRPHAAVAIARRLLGRRRAGREVAQRPLLIAPVSTPSAASTSGRLP